MQFLKDLGDILKKYDTTFEHDMSVTFDAIGVLVELMYDVERTEDEVIPIRYETLGEFAFIPDDEYREKYKPNDYGIDLNEIKMIKDIMEYLENHKTEINEVCSMYSSYLRECENQKEKEND